MNDFASEPEKLRSAQLAACDRCCRFRTRTVVITCFRWLMRPLRLSIESTTC
jgi:hypothetical protein